MRSQVFVTFRRNLYLKGPKKAAGDKSKFDYDLVVIGGGSGGLAAAKEAAKVNPDLKVACFDYVAPSPQGTTWGLGGTCVNVGCVPKKLMHYTATLGHKQHDAKEYGWQVSDHPAHSWETMSRTVLDYIKSLNWIYKQGLVGANVQYINALASFLDPNTIQYQTGKGKTLKTSTARVDKAILAVGGRPAMGDVPGKELCISSDDLFWLKKNPGKTLVIGAGYIALECAGFLNGLGNDVSVMVRGKVMRVMDQMSANQVAEMMERRGVRFIMPAHAVSFAKRPDASAVQFQPPAGSTELDNGLVRFPPGPNGEEKFLHPSGAVETRVTIGGRTVSTWNAPEGPIQVQYKVDDDSTIHTELFDTVLMAIGRTANIEGLGLQQAGVEVKRGKVVVDEKDQSSASNIFALGDCSITRVKTPSRDIFQERPELTPVAVQAGQLLARRIAGKNKAVMDYSSIPTTVFTPDEYAFVGMSQDQAEKPVAEGGIGKENVVVYASRFGNLEISPTHAVVKELRSKHFTGKQLWAAKYAKKHNLHWPDVSLLDPATNPLAIFTKDGKNVEVELVNTYQSSNGEWVHEVKEGETVHRDVPSQHLQPTETDLNGQAEILLKANGLAKLVCDASNGEKVVGLHFIGENAGEVCQGFALALKKGVTKQDFDALVGIHPTMAEEFTVLSTPLSEGKSYLKKAGCGGGSCG